MSSDKRVKGGELVKYRNRLLGWKKYYFKLERSYLHYFESQYSSEPIKTITRGEISKLQFTQPLELNKFEIHVNSGMIWHLQADNHEERMEWMQILQPNIIDPLKTVLHSPMVGEQSQPCAPPEELGNQQTFYHPIYPQLNLCMPTTNDAHAQGGFMPCPLNSHTGYSPPPAYDDVNYTH